MRSIVEFVKVWYADAADELRRADPLLMGAAFAYNALFAVVPLALAFVTTLTFFDATKKVLENAYELIDENLPPDIAAFLNQILQESVAAVDSNRLVIIIVTLLVALWSGSRAVYTIQKALRLVEGSDVEVGYVRMRSTGIAVTVGAGIGVIVAYTLALLGTRISNAIRPQIPGMDIDVSGLLLTILAFCWVFTLLYAVYRWGAPQPIRQPAGTALVVTSILALGTWAALNVIPADAAASVAVFGSFGIILFWMYSIGIVVVGGPIAVGSLLAVLDANRQQ